FLGGCHYLSEKDSGQRDLASTPYQALRYGVFFHWVSGDNQARSGCGLVKPDGSASSGINAYCNELNIDKVVEDIDRLGFEIVYVTDFHGLGTVLHPSEVIDRWRGKGRYTAERDVLGEFIKKLKAKGIGVVLFTHPLDGHDYEKEQQELLGWNDPTDHFKRWNDFVNDVYAELATRYGKEIVGIGFDGAWGNQSHEKIDGIGKIDQKRLRETLKNSAPTVPLISLCPPNQTTDLYIREVWRPYWFNWDRFEGVPLFAQPEKGGGPPVFRKEDYDTDLWPAYNRPPAIVITDHWTVISKRDKSYMNVSGEAMFRYTVLQHGVSYNGPAVLWAVSPYVTGEWPIDVYEQFMVVQQLMTPIRESLRGTYPSTSFITPEGKNIQSLTNGFVATRTPDHTAEYIHVLRPPTGQTLELGTPADLKGFAEQAVRLPGGERVKLTRKGTSYSLAMPDGMKWEPLDTVFKLTVVNAPPENLALYKPVIFSSSDETTGLNANPFWHAGLTDGRHNKAWSSGKSVSASAPQWMVVDLLKPCTISRVTLWAYDWEYPTDFTIETSVDNTHFSVVTRRENQAFNDRRYDCVFNPIKARYVRVTATHVRATPKIPLEIKKAVYGVPGREADVTELIRTQVATGQAFKAGISLFKVDPAPGVNKRLRVEYSLDGKDNALSVGEGLDFPPLGQPTRLFRLQEVEVYQ
ncbi:MAG: discoidin domain-containing protein, partial [bacterium]